MDNRPTVVQMRPQNRRKVIVSTDLVTGGLRGFNTDNFNLGNVLKGAGNLASSTGLPFVSGVGKAVSGIVSSTQANKAAKKAGVSTAGTSLSDWEGKLLRDKSDPKGSVYLIKNGTPVYQSSLTDAQWKTVTDVSSLPGQGTVQKVTSITPTISPLPISVPKTPADANILAAVQASQNAGAGSQTLAEQLQQIVANISPQQQAAIREKAQQIYDSGSNGILTAAQKKLQDLSTNILPKTKPVKDAEALLTAPQHGGIKSAGSSLSFSSPWVIGGIVLVAVVILIVAIKR